MEPSSFPAIGVFALENPPGSRSAVTRYRLAEILRPATGGVKPFFELAREIRPPLLPFRSLRGARERKGSEDQIDGAQAELVAVGEG